jgi:hypothetical protein
MTDIERVRTLIGPTNSAFFTDDQISFFLDLQSGSLLLAAAVALESLAASTDVTPKQVSIGKFEYSVGRAQIKQLTAQAEAFRKMEFETPACAVIEEGLSEFNRLTMLHNLTLKGVV